MRQSRHAASLALLIPTALGASEQQTWRVQRYPLAAFRIEHPDRVRFTEDHWPAQHIAIDGLRAHIGNTEADLNRACGCLPRSSRCSLEGGLANDSLVTAIL